MRFLAMFNGMSTIVYPILCLSYFCFRVLFDVGLHSQRVVACCSCRKIDKRSPANPKTEACLDHGKAHKTPNSPVPAAPETKDT